MTDPTPPEYRLSNLMPESTAPPATPAPVNRDREIIKQAAVGLLVFLVGIVGAGVYVLLAFEGYLPKLW